MNLKHVQQLMHQFALWFDQAIQRAEGVSHVASSESLRSN